MVGGIGNDVDYGGLGLNPTGAERKDELGQEEFLNLMVTQLKNQDPFKPLESGEFLGQLAQFGTVSGLAELKTSFASLASSLVSNQALQAAGLVGRSVLVPSDGAVLENGGSVVGAVDLPDASNAVRVEIRDAAGELVQRLDLGARSAGLVRFEWDGTTGDGEPAPAGHYTVSAMYQGEDDTVAADTLVTAPVDSVVFGANGFAVQVRGIGTMPFSDVREIGG